MNKAVSFALLATLAGACVSRKPQSVDKGTKEVELGRFRATWYYLVSEEEFPAEGQDIAIYDMNDRPIAKVHPKFKKSLDIQGSGLLSDGRVVNYAGRKSNLPNQRIRYLVVDAPFGLGARNCELDPFHTIAVDPKRIPLGSLVQIEETIGMKLPDGSIHDGLWKADDTGDAIQSDRIDMFVGPGYASGKVFANHGIKHLQPLKITLIKTARERGRTCMQRGM